MITESIKKRYINGLKAGISIGLGYLSVSFAFGIMAVSYGFYPWQAVVISMLTLTSAGQFAGIGIMLIPGQYMSMLISQLTINVRYSFMGISLSQKLDEKFKGIWKWLFGYFITDEIFAVAVSEETVGRSFFLGLSTLPWIGWTAGTLLGAVLGNILPEPAMSALGIAIYGMFVAIVVPDMKKSKSVVLVVLLSSVLSVCFNYAPYLKEVPMGISISLCAIISAIVISIIYPIPDEAKEEA